jgi:hypothetical protein
LLDSGFVPIYRYLMGKGNDLTSSFATVVFPAPSAPMSATVNMIS